MVMCGRPAGCGLHRLSATQSEHGGARRQLADCELEANSLDWRGRAGWSSSRMPPPATSSTC